MGNTGIYGWPYPELTDPPDSPAQVKALAQAIEASLKSVTDRLSYSGTVTVTNPGSTSGSIAVTFPAGYFSTPPIVQLTCVNASVYIPSAAGVTATGCSVVARYYLGTNHSSTIPVQWTAHRMPGTAVVLTSEPREEEFQFETVIATCRTEGCPNEGVALEIMRIVGSPVGCGMCGQPIDDVVPAGE